MKGPREDQARPGKAQGSSGRGLKKENITSLAQSRMYWNVQENTLSFTLPLLCMPAFNYWFMSPGFTKHGWKCISIRAMKIQISRMIWSTQTPV